MSIAVLKLPDVKEVTESRPTHCPSCKGEIFQRWGYVKKPLRDTQYRSAQVYCYRCCTCRCTFRHYPEGVDRADQTKRLRKLAALCWTLGLSYRGVAAVFANFGVEISRMTVWRDGHELATLYYLSLATGSTLDERRNGTGDWVDEDAQQARAGLQELVGNAGKSDAGWFGGKWNL